MPQVSAAETAALTRALELAHRGPAQGPNPRVGCVLLDPAGNVLAEGWHSGAGTLHAEAAALAAVPADRRADLAGATAVVTLEPCRHHGRTPPCADALADAGITRVVYAVADPNPEAGGGAARLAERGVRAVAADTSAARAAADFLEPWLTAVGRGRPWLIGKTACSLDGRVTAADGTSQWITSRAAREHAHRTRATVDAIVVGTGTVLADDPALTARLPGGDPAPHQPVRVVVGHRGVPAGARLHSPGGRLLHYATHDLEHALAELAHLEVRTALLEGGPTLLTAALAAGLVDELHVYLAPVLLGAGRAAVGDLGIPTLAVAPRWRVLRADRLGEDVHLVLRPPSKPRPTTEEAEA